MEVSFFLLPLFQTRRGVGGGGVSRRRNEVYGPRSSHATFYPLISCLYRLPRIVFLAPGSIGCIFGELLIKDAIMKGTGELDVSVVHRPPGRMVRRSGDHIASTSSRDMLSTPPSLSA